MPSSLPDATVAALARFPRLLVALVVGVLLLAGLVLGGAWSALLLAPVIVLMGLLTAAAWPLLPPAQRGLRVVVLLVLAMVALSRLW